jgi:hypothetical protein
VRTSAHKAGAVALAAAAVAATALLARPVTAAPLRPVARPADGTDAALLAERKESKKRKTEKDPNPTPLWSLYPLNPAVSGTPAAPPEEATDLTARSQEATTEGDAVPSSGSTDDGMLLLAGAGAAALLLVAGLVWLAARRRTTPSRVGAGAASTGAASPRAAAAAAPPSTNGPAPAAAQPLAIAREHVRVHLSDGRSIEGWRRGSYSTDQRVVVLDVDNVYDAAGNKVAATPLDSFLLPPQIARIERFESPGPSQNDSRR